MSNDALLSLAQNIGGAQVAVGEVGQVTGRGLVRSLSVSAVRAFQSLVAYGGAVPDRALNACITYITLDMNAILASVLDRPRRPVLTRALAAADASPLSRTPSTSHAAVGDGMASPDASAAQSTSAEPR
jgi:hypothetical protein